jgi:hypothetical protein
VTYGVRVAVGVEGPVIENAKGAVSITKLYKLFVATVAFPALSIAVKQR